MDKEIKITYKYNPKTGETIEFIVDDELPEAPESYHDEISKIIIYKLFKNVKCQDALQNTDSAKSDNSQANNEIKKQNSSSEEKGIEKGDELKI